MAQSPAGRSRRGRAREHRQVHLVAQSLGEGGGRLLRVDPRPIEAPVDLAWTRRRSGGKRAAATSVESRRDRVAAGDGSKRPLQRGARRRR